MNIEEILQYLSTSLNGEVVISKEILTDYKTPIVREIYIQKEFVVRIEFNDYGYDEGGFTIYFQYENMEVLVSSLECYLDKSIIKWENYNKTGSYPSLDNISLQSKKFKDDLKSKNLYLPKEWISYQVKNNYWLQFFQLIEPI